MELVVGASEATMKSLLGKLGGLLAQEYALIRGVRGDVQYINDELASMQAFLRDLSAAPDGHVDNRMKDWMKQIRDMAYDVEDCVDNFARRLPRDPTIADARCCSFAVATIYELRTWWPRRDIASRIAGLKLRAQQIAERRSRYGVNNPSDGGGGARLAAYSDVAEHQRASRRIFGTKDPVGMKADMEKLENWVTSRSNAERTVLSVVGFGGVGKTTIATALYRRFQNEFECRASVTVSQNYDEDAVLRSILDQLVPQGSSHGSQQGVGAQRQRSFQKKSLAAHMKGKLKKIRGRSQQGKDGSLDAKKIDFEAMNRDQLVEELKQCLATKRKNG